MSKKSVFSSLITILIILVVGGVASYILITTGPETLPEENTSSARIVQTIPLIPQDRSVSVSVQGSVVPSRKVTLRPQVSGQVIEMSDSVSIGGYVEAGEELIRIDPKDYELALAETRANFEQAHFEREVESGRQVIAKREWNELQADLDMAEVNRSLVLREPHLRRAEALMEKANNDIEVAELQLSRTVILAPFNAKVVDEFVEVGQLLNPGSNICELVGTDEFWVQVSVPFSKLKWIAFNDEGQPGTRAKVILDVGEEQSEEWEGEVLRLLGDLDPDALMAQIIITVKDPLGLHSSSEKKLPLLLGSFVEVEIDAGELKGALTIPREALREGHKIWLVGVDNLLRVADAEILWPEKDTVLISTNLKNGEQLIVSDLRVALPGLEVDPQPSTAYPELVTR